MNVGRPRRHWLVAAVLLAVSRANESNARDHIDDIARLDRKIDELILEAPVSFEVGGGEGDELAQPVGLDSFWRIGPDRRGLWCDFL